MKGTTGHNDPTINGETIAEWLRPTLLDEANRFNVPMPSDAQIALVVSAMRMHSLMVYASTYDRSELGKPDTLTDFYPIESSIGRFFRDSSRLILDEHEQKFNKRRQGTKQVVDNTITLCDSCWCMTKMINGKCGKCKASKL